MSDKIKIVKVNVDDQKEIAEKIQSGETTRIIIGSQAINSPYYSLIEIFAREIATASNSQFGYLTDGAPICFTEIVKTRKCEANFYWVWIFAQSLSFAIDN